jgi:hypothetical protein
LTPYRITEAHYVENRFLNDVGNGTNSHTFLDIYLSDGLSLERGNGTIETTNGQNIG